MQKSTSFYLDFLRVIAAFGVLFVHANLPYISNGLFFPEQLGHKLVMIFFVLSGYLIAFTVDKKNKGAQMYLTDRFSRLYSVVLPALIFTYIIDFIGKHYNPDFYNGLIAPDHQGVRFLLNATFLSQAWTLSTKPSSNGPFWSISYEFWYYILFWAFIYIKGAKKYLAFLFICLIIGIKILLLLPVWMLGVLAYRLGNKIVINKYWASGLFITTSIAIIILMFYWDFSLFSERFVFGKPPLYFSSRFVFDWVFGILVAVNMFSFNYFSYLIKIPHTIDKTIKYLSSVTFSLYLFHAPILFLIAALFKYDKSSYLQVSVILSAVLLIVLILSQITEKQRYYWKTGIGKLFDDGQKLINRLSKS